MKKEVKEASVINTEINTIKEGAEMKKSIIILIIGVIVGAVITSGIFMICRPKYTRNIPHYSQTNRMNKNDRRDFNKYQQRDKNNEVEKNEKNNENDKKEDENKS